ncbi:uncharacterized protein PRCAT00001546001 [Priceomyces carsonii]|uniref:uncharacterized protein n=1 Tax=Priceomyces carsonii TaxID=28549 RepID=UPI002EDB2072|nr:unnamed protein product [Priceomyces carsonii]
MEFYDPVVDQSNEALKGPSEENKTDEAVLKLEDEIDKVYSSIENKFQYLWSTSPGTAKNSDKSVKLENHKKEIVDQLNKVRENVTDNAKVKEGLSQIEDQLRNLHVPEVDLKKLQSLATTALDSLDSTLEKVEKQAGLYVSQFASMFSNIIQVSPEEERQEAKIQERETLFTSPLGNNDNYGSTRFDNELLELHTSKTPYLSAVLDKEEELKTFNADSRTSQISDLLDKYPNTLTKLMNSIVPVSVPYNVFWYRYFKNVDKLKESEQARRELLNNKDLHDGNSEQINNEADEEENFTWDDEDDDEVVDVAKEAGDRTSELKSTLSEDGEEEEEEEDDDDDDDWE